MNIEMKKVVITLVIMVAVLGMASITSANTKETKAQVVSEVSTVIKQQKAKPVSYKSYTSMKNTAVLKYGTDLSYVHNLKNRRTYYLSENDNKLHNMAK